jgi:TonB family protein
MMAIEITLKVTVILLLALAVMPLLRSRAAALRHWILAAALVCAAAVPLVRLVTPAWQVPLVPTLRLPQDRLTAGGPVVETAIVSVRVASDRAVVRPNAPSPAEPWRFAQWLFGIWVVGALAGLAVLLAGFARLARLAASARPITSGSWAERCEEMRRHCGIQRPVLLLGSAHPSLLVTWGILRPKILLPAGAARWKDDRVRLVLAHELSHIRRADWLVHLLAEMLRTIYWFNPIVWIACRRLREEAEQACDDDVLNGGVDAPYYASQLVNIARELQLRRMPVPAPSIARSSNLERRVRAMLNAHADRRPVSRRLCAAALMGLLAVTIPVTSAVVAQGSFGTLSGAIVDPMNAALTGVTVTLTNAQNQSKYEVRSDKTGRYEFVGLPPADYTLEAQLPGFAALRRRVTIAAQPAQQDLRMQIGSLQETVTIRSGGSEPQRQVADPAARARSRETPACNTSTQEGPPIGGNIRPPTKVVDVRPLYPASAVAAGAQGTVQLEATIGPDGLVNEVKVVSSPHADLAASATEAVRQWEFEPTLLNCTPVAVTMRVTLNFERSVP